MHRHLSLRILARIHFNVEIDGSARLVLISALHPRTHVCKARMYSHSPYIIAGIRSCCALKSNVRLVFDSDCIFSHAQPYNARVRVHNTHRIALFLFMALVILKYSNSVFSQWGNKARNVFDTKNIMLLDLKCYSM